MKTWREGLGECSMPKLFWINNANWLALCADRPGFANISCGSFKNIQMPGYKARHSYILNITNHRSVYTAVINILISPNRHYTRRLDAWLQHFHLRTIIVEADNYRISITEKAKQLAIYPTFLISLTKVRTFIFITTTMLDHTLQ